MTGPMPGTEVRMRWLSANSGVPETVTPIRRSSAAMAVSSSASTLPAGPPSCWVAVSDTTVLSSARWSTSFSRSTSMSRSRSMAAEAGSVASMSGNAAPEGRRYPGVHPVRPPKGPGGLREVPGLPRVHDDGGEPAGVQRLRQRPVHAPRGLHDGPRGAGLPEDAADLSEAVAVVGGREVTPVDVDVGVRLLTSDSRDHCCHALPLLAPR